MSCCGSCGPRPLLPGQDVFETASGKIVLPAYVEWAGGADSDLRRMALGGFGDVGPRAAPMALPFLAEALRSPYWDRRYVAVDALSKLGPTARPLLEEARNDPQKEVREHAARALAGGEGR